MAYGDTWTWTAIEADTKLLITWLVGGRDRDYAMGFMDDLRARLANRVQLRRPQGLTWKRSRACSARASYKKRAV